MFKEAVTFTVLYILGLVNGHGFLWEPPGRGTARFRNYTEYPFNYNHMENFCGGYQVQWEQNGGQCGVCGDPYDEQQPRRHEAGGTYGPDNRRVTGTYLSGSVVNVGINLTAYHRGFFTFRLCVNNNFSTEVTQDCLNKNLLIVSGTNSPFFDINGTANTLPTQAGYYTVPIQLPAGVVATQAVFQWNYTTGNSWRNWPGNEGCLGCGPQETFINCADIAIVAAGTTATTLASTATSANSTTTATTSTNQSTTMSVLSPSTTTTSSTATTTTPTTTTPTTTTPTSTTSPTTTSSTATTSTAGSQSCTNICYTSDACSCLGAGAYANTPGMASWCLASCRLGSCPLTHCQCWCN